jgi:hypothetical protein
MMDKFIGQLKIWERQDKKKSLFNLHNGIKIKYRKIKAVLKVKWARKRIPKKLAVESNKTDKYDLDNQKTNMFLKNKIII